MSTSKNEQVAKELAEEAGQKDASWKAAPAPEAKKMNEPREHPHSDNDLTKDQLAEEGIETDPSGSDNRRAENYREDLAEEDGQKDASGKAATTQESETQQENNDYFNGMSQ